MVIQLNHLKKSEKQKKGTKINFLPSKAVFSSIKFSPSILKKEYGN